MEEGVINLFNWVDIFILIILLRAGFVGFRRGAIGELLFSGGVILLSVVSIKYYTQISKVLVSYLGVSSNFSQIVAYCLLVIVGFVFIWLVSNIITFVTNVGRFKRLNKIFGVFVGIIRGGMICSVLLFFLILLDIDVLSKLIEKDSYLGPFMVDIPYKIYAVVKVFFS